MNNLYFKVIVKRKIYLKGIKLDNIYLYFYLRMFDFSDICANVNITYLNISNAKIKIIHNELMYLILII